ncbi:Gliding motility regulatory protein [Andreprevotia sp. IGB-42]|uniref:hybrid sensor histidine kinase/response regulator n=1 Tax=Andreprevotia sp. IGB-42 TaxID=2497473 RepID=UPI00135BE23B|nr:response regulator [Andreprevotia sp. IGB-42]KAF0815331.1 Gliding motility regulatory protein [Andreprevotia sp. IGB-42]
MTEKEERFLQRLLATFKVEASEHLQSMLTLLPELEQGPDAAAEATLIETLFREAHSLKGAARAVNQREIEMVCHDMEQLLSSLKYGEITVSPEIFETLYQALDRLQPLLVGTPAPAAPTTAPVATNPVPAGVVAGGSAVAAPASSASGPVAEATRAVPAEPVASETVRISTAKLTALLNQAEELHALKFGAAYVASEIAELSRGFAGWRKEWGKAGKALRGSRRGRARDLAAQVDGLLETFEQGDARLRLLDERLQRIHRSAEQERRSMAGMIDGLLDDMKQALMLPFSSLLELFPKLVRDLSRDSGKPVELVIDGAAIEIDRRILEQMKDPLIHLLRNAIDHGIEKAEQRSQHGKPAQGRVSITILPQDGNQIEIAVADDGGGIRHDRIREVAARSGLLREGEVSDDEALQALVFESGFSTSPILTDISGRGLGLAIVREKVEKLGGRIKVESQQGQGTCFRIVLPATLATFRGVLVSIGDRQFVLPSVNVERVARVARHTVSTVENRDTIPIDGQIVGLVWLADVLGLVRPRSDDDAPLQVVVLGNALRRIAFVVDAVLADQEVLVKPLGPQLQRLRNIAAATVLGAGKLVPILNVPDLLLSAIRVAPAGGAVQASAPEHQQRSLLVADDSVTSRSLFKNILETAGYRVTTAVDGLDALTTLRVGQFDLVVSDVEMPRMDGFELATQIRRDSKLKALPVVLVTALDSREDREHGINVGADAYIVKGSFDQGNLLEVVRRLL